MKNVEALKALYEALGGEASDVADASTSVEVLNAIAAKYDGADDASLNPVAISNIAAVADQIGGGGSAPSGKDIVIADEQTVTGDKEEDYDWYSAALDDYIAPTSVPDEVIVTFDGTNYVVPKNNDGSYGATIDWDNGTADFSEYPFQFYVYGYGYMYFETEGSHTVVIKYHTDTITIQDNGEYDVAGLSSVNVLNPANAGKVTLNVVNNGSADTGLGWYGCCERDGNKGFTRWSLKASAGQTAQYILWVPLVDGNKLISCLIPAKKTFSVTSNTQGVEAKKSTEYSNTLSIIGSNGITECEVTVTFS